MHKTAYWSKDQATNETDRNRLVMIFFSRFIDVLMKNKIDEMMSSFGVVRVKLSVHVVKKVAIEGWRNCGVCKMPSAVEYVLQNSRRSNYLRHAFRYLWIVSIDGALI